MALMRAVCVSFLLVLAISGIPGNGTESSPTVNCLTEKMDILFLVHESESIIGHQFQFLAISHLFNQLSIYSNETTSNLMFAIVYDMFSALNPTVNVTSWQFSSTFPNVYGANVTRGKKQKFPNVQEAVDVKAQFVQRLFSEMIGVRENVSHVAVMLLDGYSLSRMQHSNKVPPLTEWEYNGVKILIVVAGGTSLEQTIVVFGNKILLQPRINLDMLFMHICKRCPPGLSLFERNEGGQSLSCYLLIDRDVTNGLSGISLCSGFGWYTTTVESEEEMRFLKDRLRSEFHRKGLNSSVKFYIGLFRDSKHVNSRLHWWLTYPVRQRPLVVNNWLPGTPSSQISQACVMWKFLWSSYDNDVTNISRSEGYFVDKWTDIECETETRFSLCKISLPQSLNDLKSMGIKAATDEHFNQVLTKGDFIKFGDNIMSVSTHIASK